MTTPSDERTPLETRVSKAIGKWRHGLGNAEMLLAALRAEGITLHVGACQWPQPDNEAAVRALADGLLAFHRRGGLHGYADDARWLLTRLNATEPRGE